MCKRLYKEECKNELLSFDVYIAKTVVQNGLSLVPSAFYRIIADLPLARDRVEIHSNRGVFGKGIARVFMGIN